MAGEFGDPLGSAYGARGYIKSTNQSLPPQDTTSHSLQSFRVVQSDGTGNSIEVGWVVGWAWGNWYTSPHMFVALDIPNGGRNSQIVGPAVGQTTAWYEVWWNASNEYWAVRANHGGTLLWSGHQAAGTPGAGDLEAMGEVSGNATAMSGVFEGDKSPNVAELGYADYGGTTWHAWWPPGALCSDPGYYSSGDEQVITDGNS
ncbi:MAG TPA: hypothetical protein VGH79_00320 [Gaiellaceae bacterium]|jgi:hypothetical protein